MNKEELKLNLTYLINKYVDEKEELFKYLDRCDKCTKYFLSEIELRKIRELETKDLKIVKDIAYYYI